MKKFLFFALPALVCFALVHSANAQERFSANEDSPTAVRRTGVTLEAVKTRGNYTRYYEFRGGELVRNMKFYRKGQVYTDPKTFSVETGVVGWLNEAGTKVVFVGCINEADLITSIPPPAVVTPPATPPCARDQWVERRRVDNGNGTMTVTYWNGCEEVPVIVTLPPSTVEECDCPTDVQIKTRATWKERLLGGWVEALLSAGGGAGTAAISDNRVGWSAGASIGLQRVYQLFNPSHNEGKINVTFSDGKTQEYKIKRGQSLSIDHGDLKGVAEWDNGEIAVKFPDCFTSRAYPLRTRNIATITIPEKGRDRSVSPDNPKTYVPPGPGAGSGNYKGFVPAGKGAGSGKAAKASAYDN